MSQAYNVTRWDPTTDSGQLHELYQSTVGSIEPYGLPRAVFDVLVTASRAVVFIVEQASAVRGFALTYLIRAGSESTASMQHDKGSLALLIVDPGHRHRGIGRALHETALHYLYNAVKTSLSLSTPISKSELQLGSIFPRIFPGLPGGEEFAQAREWFKKQGWDIKEDESIDLYRTIGDPASLHEEMRGPSKKALEAGWTFRVSSPEDDKSLLELQEREFGRFTGWPDVFPHLLASRREDVWCAYDPSGKLQGATVAAMPESYLHNLLAWPNTTGNACGAIACVGVSASSQGSGAGAALVATALEHLAERGADGCFVDWVSIKGFYEKSGFRKWARGYHESWKVVE